MTQSNPHVHSQAAAHAMAFDRQRLETRPVSIEPSSVPMAQLPKTIPICCEGQAAIVER